MKTPTQLQLEATGSQYNREDFLSARKLCQSITREIAQQAQVGMSESDGQDLVKTIFKKYNIEKFWHPTKFRIGHETTKSFRDLPDPSIAMKDGDLFFLDVGPIINGHEADYGESFLINTNTTSEQLLLKNKLINSSKVIFNQTQKLWRENNLTGEALYREATQIAENLGYSLNPKMAGHRIGDFPHALFCKEQLAKMNFTPSQNLWILEIHIVDTNNQLGAFFEDILS